MPVKRQSPPQDPLKYRLRRDKPLFDGDKAVPGDIISKWLHDYVYDAPHQSLRVTMDTPFGNDVVYLHDELTVPSTRLGLLAGGIQKGTELYKPLQIDDEGRLCVDAAISIGEVQLGVEVRALDHDSVGIWGHVDQNTGDIRPINITPNGHVKVSLVGNRNVIFVYDEGILSGSTEHVIVSYTVSIGQEFNLFKASATGKTDGIFKVKINNATVETRRNTQLDRNVEFNYSQGLPLSAGDTVEIAVEHKEGSSKPFTGTLYGELV